MNIIDYYLKKLRRGSVSPATLRSATGTSALALTACGEGSDGAGIEVKGFPSSYVPPSSSFVAPTESDPDFAILRPVYSDPYWVASL